MAYERSVEPHHNILIQFLPNKRSKEHIESKPQCQKYSNSYHLHRYEIGTPKNEILNDKRNAHRLQRNKRRNFDIKPVEGGKEVAIHAFSFCSLKAAEQEKG